jgi:hypothetical protein
MKSSMGHHSSQLDDEEKESYECQQIDPYDMGQDENHRSQLALLEAIHAAYNRVKQSSFVAPKRSSKRYTTSKCISP